VTTQLNPRREPHTKEVEQQFPVGEQIRGVHGELLAIGVKLSISKLHGKRRNGVPGVT